MASTVEHNSTEEVKTSPASCASDGRGDKAQQMDRSQSKTATARKKAVRCADCGKKFDGWRMLGRHKRKSCPKCMLRFSCRECGAFFPSKIELNNHISVAHASEKVRESKNAHHSQKKPKVNSTSCSEVSTSGLKGFRHADRDSLEWKRAYKHAIKSDDLKKLKSAFTCKAAEHGGKLRRRMIIVRQKDLDKAAVGKYTIGRNPFSFTTSCAPDAQSFQFLCQSCVTVRFATYTELRQHEDWCARVPNSHGYLCLPCGRHYRTLGTLRRHADGYHKSPVSSEAKKIIGNPFLFSTTIAMDAASHPHECSSCRLVCFASPTTLRRHEDWCGQCVSAKDGSKCEKCGRYFRTEALLERHAAADDCLKTDDTARAVDDLKSDEGSESESLGSDVKPKPAPGATIYGVCPLCDLPFISQYEQQVHFINVHNLTPSELKIKEAVQRHSRRGFIGTQVTCLDCDLVFSSRLELVQHKRICTKKKKFTKVLLPITPRMQSSVLSSGNDCCSLEDGSSTKKDSTDLEIRSASNSGKSRLTRRFGSRAEDAASTQRSDISQGLLLNTTKVRSLIRHTGAKQLLLKPDGELLLLGEGGQKISTTNGKTVITKTSADSHSVEARSSSIEDSSKPGSSENPGAVTNPTGDTGLLPTSAGSDKATVSGCGGEALKTDECINSENLEPATENLVLVCSDDNSCQSESGCCEVDRTVEEQDPACQHPDKAVSLEAENAGAAAPKTRPDVGIRRKSTRKWPLQNRITDLVDSDPENDIEAACDREVENILVMEEKPVSLSTTSKRSPHTDVKATDLPAPASASEIEVIESDPEKNIEAAPDLEVKNIIVMEEEPLSLCTTSKRSPHTDVKAAGLSSPVSAHEFEVIEPTCSSEVDDKQQLLLEALKLVPVSAEPNGARPAAARYRTRLSVTVTEGGAAKKGRYLDYDKDTPRSSKSARRALSTKPARKTVTSNKHKTADRKQTTGKVMPQKTWTVELVGDHLVRCVGCKMIFRTVRKIVDHVCSGQ